MRWPLAGLHRQPDLVERIRRDALAAVQRETLYGGREEGYTDYPLTLAASINRAACRTPPVPLGRGAGGAGACSRPAVSSSSHRARRA